MRKIILYTIDAVINIALIIILIAMAIIFKIDHRYFQIYMAITIFLGIFNLIMIMITELLVKEYKYKKFSLCMHPSYVIISTAFYYIFKYNNKLSFSKDTKGFSNYYNHQYLYVFIPIVLSLLVIVIFEILNCIKFKEKAKEFDPKKYKESEFNPEDYLDKKYGLKEDDDPHKFLNKK